MRRGLAKFGKDLALARRKRRLTVQMMSERTGISKATYLRVERGDPTVALGAYAMTMFVLGLGDVLGGLVDRKLDELGLQLDDEHVPKRVRRRASS
jgi:transcriptional regulator with XRE-family HTH domain